MFIIQQKISIEINKKCVHLIRQDVHIYDILFDNKVLYLI